MVREQLAMRTCGENNVEKPQMLMCLHKVPLLSYRNQPLPSREPPSLACYIFIEAEQEKSFCSAASDDVDSSLVLITQTTLKQVL